MYYESWRRLDDWQTICVIEKDDGDFFPVEYDVCGESCDTEIFEYIGDGRIYSVGGVVQKNWETSDIMSFWVKKDKPNGDNTDEYKNIGCSLTKQ